MNAAKGRRARKHVLDAVDWTILAALQQNARTGNGTLGKRVGLTAPSVIRRVKVLEKKKFIRGYHAKLNARKLDHGVVGFIFVGLFSQTDTAMRRFEDLVADCPVVSECLAVSGELDFILKCIASNISELQNFLTRKLMKHAGVKTIKTLIVMRTVKEEPGLPLLALHTVTPVMAPGRASISSHDAPVATARREADQPRLPLTAVAASGGTSRSL